MKHFDISIFSSFNKHYIGRYTHENLVLLANHRVRIGKTSSKTVKYESFNTTDNQEITNLDVLSILTKLSQQINSIPVLNEQQQKHSFNFGKHIISCTST